MCMSLRVSVVIPTYNRAELVRLAIESALEQSYKAHEIIVVDDGSSDNTKEVVAGFGAPVKYLFQSNAGVSAARNMGIASSTGDVVAFLDSDDVWLPRRLADLKAAMEEYPSAVASAANGLLSDTRCPILADRPLAWRGGSGVLHVSGALAVLCQPTTSGVAIRRDVLKKMGGFDPQVLEYEDLDLFSRVATQGRWTFTEEPAFVLNREEMGPSNVSHQYWYRPAEALLSLERCYCRVLSGARPQFGEAMKLRAKISGYRGTRAALAKNTGERWKILASTMSVWPTPRTLVRVTAIGSGWKPPLAKQVTR